MSTRNWSRVLGLAGTLSLHGLAVQSLVLASALHKPRAPELPGAGTNRLDTVQPAEELVAVPVDNLHGSENSDLLRQIGSLAPDIKKPSISQLLPGLPPTIDLPAEEVTAESFSQASPDATDPAVRARMFGRYIAQISARIDRAWIRPRTPVNDAAHAARLSVDVETPSSQDESFTCQVQIRQDARGFVQEVLLRECNGSAAWRHSLVVAINQSSPFGLPPFQWTDGSVRFDVF